MIHTLIIKCEALKPSCYVNVPQGIFHKTSVVKALRAVEIMKRKLIPSVVRANDQKYIV